MIKTAKRRVSRSTSLQSPVNGLNAKDAYAAMKPTEAVEMENWFPSPSSVDGRKGMVAHATGFTDPVETLMTYNSASASKLFAASDDSIFDVSTAGAVSTADVTGLANARWQHVNIGTAGGQFLLAVNGADKMLIYNGTAWDEDGGGTYTITGVDTADCIHINNFKNRIWLIENDSMKAWYLPVSSLAGAAASLNLAGLFNDGGYLVAMANWTIDNAAGVDDYAAFITSQGEVALYKGTDPSSSSTWALVGIFKMGKPIGRRCFCKAGADVLVITTDGAFPLSKALLTDRSQQSLSATDKVRNLINADIASYSSHFGWQPIIYPEGQKMIINVPRSEGTDVIQYVMNTDSKAWTVFKGWQATCFQVFGSGLFYGASDRVYQADVGETDDGANIQLICQQAFNYFGSPGTQKSFKLARPVMFSEAKVNPAIKMNVDFSLLQTSGAGAYDYAGGAVWDDAEWNDTPWESGLNITQRWLGLSGIGYSGGVRIALAKNGFSVKWQSTDIVFETGQVL